MPRSDRTFMPSPAQAAVWPRVSGNAINGVGEQSHRRPTPIFWHPPERIAHGALQTWYYARWDRQPRLKDFDRKFGGRGERKPAPIAPDRVNDTPERRAAAVKAFALANEADLVGIAPLDPRWVFEGYEVGAPWIVILGVAMDQPRLATAPYDLESPIEVMTQYNRGTRAARALANWIRGRGYAAEPHGGPNAGPVNLIPPALTAGFGELGKHGSIINRTYGSSFRLAAVTTELPLAADAPDDFAAADFCARCQVCTKACPVDAIGPDKPWVRGERKWYVDFDKCFSFFAETYGCGICIAVCPYSAPGAAPTLAEKMLRRRAVKAVREGEPG